jgi:hypothetical protein
MQSKGGFLHFQYSRFTITVKDSRTWADVTTDLERLVRAANPTARYTEPWETEPAVREFLNANCDLPPDAVSSAIRVIDA